MYIYIYIYTHTHTHTHTNSDRTYLHANATSFGVLATVCLAAEAPKPGISVRI